MTYKILFLNTVHKSFDDRVFYHQAKALSDHNHQIYIFSTQEKINTNKDGIIIVSDKLHHLKLNEQSNRFYASINQISPDIIICDSPIAVLLAFNIILKKNLKSFMILPNGIHPEKTVIVTSFCFQQLSLRD